MQETMEKGILNVYLMQIPTSIARVRIVRTLVGLTTGEYVSK